MSRNRRHAKKRRREQRLDLEAAQAATDAARNLLGEELEKRLTPIVDDALDKVGEICREMETRAAMAQVKGGKLQTSAFRELVAMFQFRLVDAVYRNVGAHRPSYYRVVGEAIDRFRDAVEFCSNALCQACNGSGRLTETQACPACQGATRIPKTGDGFNIKCEITRFANEGDPPDGLKPGGKIVLPKHDR